MEKYIKLETISLKTHNEINEKWVQQKIEEDPSILGLGDLTLRQSEKTQQTGGRLDILLQDDASDTRYTVELQLGKTDETHIIRTVEYWANERKRNANYKYAAVIIAEDITNRFFNVISLFNNSIPIIAIQIKAIKYGDEIGLDFTRVLDLITPDEEQEAGEVVDKAYWEKRGSKDTVKLAEKVLTYIDEFVEGFSLKFNKHYIGLIQNDIAKLFAEFTPRKETMQIAFKIKKSEETTAIIEDSGLDQLAYDNQWNQYRVRVKERDLIESKDTIIKLLKIAYEEYTGRKLSEEALEE
ncbi:MAG: DUF5655 domain-containing protein [Bacilli bacterium]|nr:DUF5655 domain-containing protein [Bacilli bacterium]